MRSNVVETRPTGVADRVELVVTQSLTGGRGQLFGGCLLAAAAEHIEIVANRPVVWMTTQFCLPANVDDVIVLDVQPVVAGRRLSQVTVQGSIDGNPHSTTLAAAGNRPFADEVASRLAPACRPRAACDELDFDPGQGGLNQRVTVLAADEDTASPRRTSTYWFRFNDHSAGDRSTLCVAADFFPPTLSAAVGRRVFGASLDNTIRFVGQAECEWLQVEMTVDGLRDGIAHGTTHIWSEHGNLLAIASQTCAVSEFDLPTSPHPDAARTSA